MPGQNAITEDQPTSLKDFRGPDVQYSSLDPVPMGAPIDPEITDELVWTLEYALPWQMLEKYTSVVAPALGVEWRTNFYKCADMTSHPHWLTWSEVPLDSPGFYQPQYFGYLLFAE